jgi:Tol biopolymer transport system component
VSFMTSGATSDVWVYNFARGSATKLTSDGSNQFPIWSPDGKRLTYRATRAGTRNIFWRMADGSGTESPCLYQVDKPLSPRSEKVAQSFLSSDRVWSDPGADQDVVSARLPSVDVRRRR